MEVKNDDALPVSTPTSSPVLSSSSSGIPKKENSSYYLIFIGRGRYKFWALATILLLAFWSMAACTVTLRLFAGNIDRFSDDYHSPAADDLDVLDMEEREKLVKHMWGVYMNSKRIGLTGFWQDAFVAAYEDLISEVPEVREASILEIARMSAHYIKLEPPLHSSLSMLQKSLECRKCDEDCVIASGLKRSGDENGAADLIKILCGIDGNKEREKKGFRFCDVLETWKTRKKKRKRKKGNHNPDSSLSKIDKEWSIRDLNLKQVELREMTSGKSKL